MIRSSSVAAAGLAARSTRLSAHPMLYIGQAESPLGELIIAAGHDAVYLVEFLEPASLQGHLDALTKQLGWTFQDGVSDLTEATATQLHEYFSGNRQEFTIPIATPGTRLQQQVWERIAATPFGATVSYSAIAREIQRPRAYRAVGRATGENRLALLVPCHRVVGAEGALTGYAAGTGRKRWLLDHESSVAGASVRHRSSYR